MNLRRENIDLFPSFAVNLDETFQRYSKVYLIGDVHDNENLFRTFLVEKGIAFVPNVEPFDYKSLDNYFVKPDILLVFLGDVTYKTPDHFKCIMRFILNNTENCLLILGNNEIKFVYEHIQLFIDFAKKFMSVRFLRQIRENVDRKESNKIVSTIYSVISRLHKNYISSKLKENWLWYYACLFEEYLLNKSDKENLMIVMYIITKSIVMGVSKRFKLLLMHAGLNPSFSLHRQRICDVCNIRYVKGTKMPWYVYYTNLDYTIVFGHWSALTNTSHTPFTYNNLICIDTECWLTQTLSYILLYPYTSKRDSLNIFNIQTSCSGLYTFHEIGLQSSITM